MLKLALLNVKGEKVKDINLNENIWGITPNDSVLHNAIILAQASLRQGTNSTKTRAEVSGGGRKPHAQKGTGRARAGSTRAPHWTGGGIIFGPTPRDYGKKMNKKERRLAIKSAYAYKFLNKELIGLENLDLVDIKTKDMVALLENLKVTGKVLFATSNENEKAILSARNLKNVEMMDVTKMSVLDITKCKYLVIDEASLEKLEEVLL